MLYQDASCCSVPKLSTLAVTTVLPNGNKSLSFLSFVHFSIPPLSPSPKDQLMHSFFLVLINGGCLPGASNRCAVVIVCAEPFKSPFWCCSVLRSTSVTQVGIWYFLSCKKGPFGLLEPLFTTNFGLNNSIFK